MPVLGFLPIFEVFSLILKLPKPLISTFSPFCRDSLMEANTELIINYLLKNTELQINLTDRLRKVK